MSMPPVQSAPGDQAGAVSAMLHLARLSAARMQGRSLTEDELKQLDEVAPCTECGGFHVRNCPRVKRLAYHPNGTLSEVEYWRHDEIDWTGVIFEDQGENDELSGDQSMIKDLGYLLQWMKHRKPDEHTAQAVRRLELWFASVVQSQGEEAPA